MTFLTPLIAAIAAAIAIPALVILYFLKLKRRDVEVSTTLLWKKAIQDLQANAPFQKLRRNILLLLQLLALCAILLALAQPEFSDKGLTNQKHILLIDRSASMSSTDGSSPPASSASSAPAASSSASSSLTRLDAAKKQALQIIDNLKEPTFLGDAAEEAMIIAFDSSAQVRQNFTASKADLRAAVNAIEPSSCPSSIERAYTLAQAYTGKEKFEKEKGFVPVGPPSTIHILSDGRLPDALNVRTGAQDKVLYHALGSDAAPNVGITTIRVVRAFDDPNKLSIFVGLASTLRTPATIDVELAIDNNLLETRPINTSAATPPPPAADPDSLPEPWTPGLGGFVFQLNKPEAGIGTIRLKLTSVADGAVPIDTLPTDDTAYFVFPPARRLSVAVVSEGSLWLRYALDALKLSRVDFLSPIEYQKLLDAGTTAQYDVTIFDKVLPLVEVALIAPSTPTPSASAPSPATSPATSPTTSAPPTVTKITKKIRTVPPGRSLVLGAVPAPPTGALVVGQYDTALIADVKNDHPALSLSGLDKLALGKGPEIALEPETPVHVLASSDKGPALLEVLDASTQSLIVTFDPFSTNWPLDSGWVLFLQDTLLYLGQTNSGTIGASGTLNASASSSSGGVMLQTGDTLTQRLPVGATDARLTLPDNQRVSLNPGPDGLVVFSPVEQTGLYTLSWSGQASAIDSTSNSRAVRVIAANLANPQESDTPAASKLALAREVVSAAGDQQVKLTRKLWPWLILGCLGLMLIEWYVYNRKVAV